MRIAQIISPVLKFPPKKYGGTERVVYTLTEELVRRGHDVTLFASGDARTSAKLEAVTPINLLDAGVADPYGANPWTVLTIGKAYSMQEKFDIIHDHTWHLGLPTAEIATTPAVFTVHGPFTIDNKKIFETLRKPYIVTISKSQAIPVPKINHVGTVYHGFDMQHYPFSPKHDGYLLFVGRISQEKGIHYAIDAAKYLNMPLIIAAKVDSVEMKYYEEYVKPRLGGKIKWIGEVDEEDRNKLMSRAMAFLHPACWREPFGLAIIEAMACGAPVIGFNRGSVPELVEDGVSGFVVEDTLEMIDAITRIDSVDREKTRNYALEKFSVKNMVDGYEAIYERILARGDKIIQTPKIIHRTNGNGKLKNGNGLYLHD